MKNKEIFNWLVREHVGRDWINVRKHVENGILTSVKVVPGNTENPYYGGILLFAKGKKFAANLKKMNIVLAGRMNVSYNISTFDRFSRYCKKFRVEDGATVIDKSSELAYHVSVFNNNPQIFWTFKERWNFAFKGVYKTYKIGKMLPSDFTDHKGVNKVGDSMELIGNKTYVAIVLPQAYPKVHTFQIKRTAYTPLGMGKVTHFDSEGLLEEFYLAYMPKHKGKFLDSAHKVVGIYRYYDRSRGVKKIFRRELIIGFNDLRNIGMN